MGPAGPAWERLLLEVGADRRAREVLGERILQPHNPRDDVAAAAANAATDQQPAVRGGDGPKASWVEVVATVILALAAVATAWSGYQASRWHGEQAIAFGHANAARADSTRASTLANTQTEIDVTTFTQWVDAYARHETELAEFYRKRFRKEFRRPWRPGWPPNPYAMRTRP